MFARMRVLCRAGTIKPGWQHRMSTHDYEGRFVMTRVGRIIQEHRRLTAEASFFRNDNGPVMQLIDAAVISVNGNRLRVSGLEYDEISQAYRLQSWDIEFMSIDKPPQNIS